MGHIPFHLIKIRVAVILIHHRLKLFLLHRVPSQKIFATKDTKITKQFSQCLLPRIVLLVLLARNPYEVTCAVVCRDSIQMVTLIPTSMLVHFPRTIPRKAHRMMQVYPAMIAQLKIVLLSSAVFLVDSSICWDRGYKLKLPAILTGTSVFTPNTRVRQTGERGVQRPSSSSFNRQDKVYLCAIR